MHVGDLFVEPLADVDIVMVFLLSDMLTELREKAGAMPTGIGFSPVLPPPAVGVEADALSALVNLGYRRAEAQSAIAKALDRLGDAPSIDAVIREGLKELAR